MTLRNSARHRRHFPWRQWHHRHQRPILLSERSEIMFPNEKVKSRMTPQPKRREKESRLSSPRVKARIRNEKRNQGAETLRGLLDIVSSWGIREMKHDKIIEWRATRIEQTCSHHHRVTDDVSLVFHHSKGMHIIFGRHHH